MARRRTFGSIRKLPSGQYQARYTDETGRRFTAPGTFPTKSDASHWLADVETSMAGGTWVDPEAGRIPCSEYSRSWLEHRPGLRPRTVDLYEGQLERHILPELGQRTLREITPAAVRAWYGDLVRNTPDGSLIAAKCYRLLRAILETARVDGLIGRNPCLIEGAGAERSPERPVATLAQVWALADAVPHRYRALVLTAAFAGLRFGELAALTRSSVDLDAGLITIAESLVQHDDGTLRIGPPKSEAGRRMFTIPWALVPELQKHLDTYVGPEADARLFIGPKGGLLRRSNWHTLWDRARKEVGPPGFHLHDLRHTCNTLTAATGASTSELMHRMGHASPRAALRYQHATRERDVAIAQALDEIIEKGTP
ncbi:MAG: site-specific integrase [Actinobacteria bacterium]|nr:MAG: site-specific integrase [Actinomycetota bacterium]RIK07568.1 MAG: site-specific integrase [Acidobacteriota bacterium]